MTGAQEDKQNKHESRIAFAMKERWPNLVVAAYNGATSYAKAAIQTAVFINGAAALAMISLMSTKEAMTPVHAFLIVVATMGYGFGSFCGAMAFIKAYSVQELFLKACQSLCNKLEVESEELHNAAASHQAIFKAETEKYAKYYEDVKKWIRLGYGVFLIASFVAAGTFASLKMYP